MNDTVERRFEAWRRRGDTRALSEVFDELAPRLLRLAIHLVGDMSTAEDLVQTTFVSAIESAGMWDSSRPLEPWLTGILDHRAKNVLKLRRDRNPTDADVLVDDDTPLARAIADEHSRELVKALDQLQEPFRSAMILSALHGLKPAAIAHALDRSPGAVRVQLHRAREMLRKSLPVGIASALALLVEPARGLDAVRSEVLASATRLATSAGVIGAGLSGGLLMKKWAVALALLVVGLAVFLVASRDAEQPQSAPAGRETVALAAPEPRAQVGLTATTATPAPEPARSAVPSVAMPHRFVGRVLQFPGDAPVAGATIELHAPVRVPLQEFEKRWARRAQMMTSGEVLRFFVDDERERRTLLQAAGLEPLTDYAIGETNAAVLSRATTDAEGRFDLSSPEEDGLLVVRATGFGERRHVWLPRDDDAPRDVYVTRASRFEARLVDESGAPFERRVKLVLNAHTRFVLGVPKPGQRDEIHGDSVEVETDERGRLAIDVAAGALFVESADPTVGVREFGLAIPGGPRCERLPFFRPGEDTGDFVIVVREMCVLAVRDAQTDAPIEHFHLAARRRPGSRIQWSNWDGWFTVPDGEMRLTPRMDMGDVEQMSKDDGPWSCTLWAPGHAVHEFKIDDPWKAQRVEVRLEPGRGETLAGRVTRAGVPAADVPIVVYPQYGKTWRVPGEDPNIVWTARAAARSQADGTFEIEMLPGRGVAMFCAGAERVVIPVDVPQNGLVVELTATGRLRVSVTLPGGAPAVDRRIQVNRPDGGRIEGRTDDLGEYFVASTIAGEHRVACSSVQALNRDTWDVERTVDVREGAEAALQIALEEDRPRFGRLVVAGMAEIVGWRAQVRGWSESSVEVEASGRIPIDLRTANSLEFAGPDGFGIIVSVPKDAADGHVFDVDAGPAGYEGVLTSGADGKPIAGVRVYAYLRDGTGGGMRTATTDATGSFRVRGLARVPQQIVLESASRTGENVANVTVHPTELPSDPPARLDLSVPTRRGAGFTGCETVQITGRLSWASAPVAGAQAQFSSKLEQPGASVYATQIITLGPEGRYDVTLPRGDPYSAWFWQPSTGAKQSVSWSGTGAPIENHDVDLP